MYGPGPGPVTPQPKPADPTTAVVLRVILTIVPVVTLGFLAWVSMLYLAVLRKRAVDWLLLAVVAGMGVIAAVCFGLSQDEDDWQSNTGGTLILICMFGGAAYFLVADIVRYRVARRAWPAASGYPQPNPYATGFGGGGPMAGPMAGPMGGPPRQGYPVRQQYPGPAAPTTPIPSVSNTPVSRPAPTPPPSRPATPPPANRPATGPATPPPAPRIDQVRAELDELSDFLRKERGDGRDGGEGEAAR